MSASPTIAPTQSAKRPLEDPSSPSAPNDQPEAKRPALDKIIKGDGTQSIESTIPSGRGQNASGSTLQHDESGWIHIRSVITSAEAATVIGKGGENVSLIRKMSGAKCTVSDYQKGAVERILTVSGVVDAVAKVCPDLNLLVEIQY
jgi:heterogeneous nuclear rnp K-like protein 2